MADLQSATAINKRGLQQYCVQASFRSPLFVTLRYLSASRHRIAVMGGLWELVLRGMRWVVPEGDSRIQAGVQRSETPVR